MLERLLDFSHLTPQGNYQALLRLLSFSRQVVPLCDPMDCITSGFPVLMGCHQEFGTTRGFPTSLMPFTHLIPSMMIGSGGKISVGTEGATKEHWASSGGRYFLELVLNLYEDSQKPWRHHYSLQSPFPSSLRADNDLVII